MDEWERERTLLDSEDGPGDAELSASKLKYLREAIDDEDQVFPSPPSTTQQSTSRRRQSLRDRDSVANSGIAQTVYGESPRKCNTKTAQPSRSEFIMPSVDSLPSNDRYRTTRSSAQLPQQSPKQARMEDSEVRQRNKPTQAERPPRERSASRPRRAETNYPSLFWSHVVYPFLEYVFSVLSIALSVAKPLISYALLFWLLIGASIFLRNFAYTTYTKALTPLCRIPGASYMNWEFCNEYFAEFPKGTAEFDRLLTAQSAFEEVFTASVWEGNLPIDMKKSELAVRDLKLLVQNSDIPSKNELTFELVNFIETAKEAGTDLASYNTRIGRGIDKILTTNKWTLQQLAGIADTEANRGAIPRFISNVNIFNPFMTVEHTSEELMMEQYLRHTATIQDEIDALIVEAQVLLRILNNLDERLDVIGDIAARDGIKAQVNQDELFANLWTWIGGNKQGVDRTKRQLTLLGNVSTYRKLAIAHVTGTIIKLQDIAANLEDLRERVTAPEILGTREGMPLSMHIGQIQLGVERLENLRQEGREFGKKQDRAILGKDEKPIGIGYK